MTRFNTRIDMAPETRANLSQALDVALGTTLDLASQVKQAHWTIRGPHFIARHELFDDLAAHLATWSDDLAERAAALGSRPHGTVREASKHSNLPEYDLDAVDGQAHVTTLANRYGRYCSLMREMVGSTQKMSDPATEDLFTEVLRAAEKDMWFLESML